MRRGISGSGGRKREWGREKQRVGEKKTEKVPDGVRGKQGDRERERERQREREKERE